MDIQFAPCAWNKKFCICHFHRSVASAFTFIMHTAGNKSIIELSFNMAMIKEWINLCSSNIWRLEHAVAYAMGYIKLWSVL